MKSVAQPEGRVPSARPAGPLGMPGVAYDAYQNAERILAVENPGCNISWNLLAGIGRVESTHGFGKIDDNGYPLQNVYGPVLDGSLYGNNVIATSDGGDLDGLSGSYRRAVGPMQFLPETWRKYAADGNGDGIADPQNIYDATLTAGKYLCEGGLDMRDPGQQTRAILRYNNSMAYVANVMAWETAYGSGVSPSAAALPASEAPAGVPRLGAMPVVTESDVRGALAKVNDPEIRKPITELGMVKSVEVGADSSVHVVIYLTTSACPMKTAIQERVTKAVADVAGVGAITVALDVMNDEQRTELRRKLRGDAAEPVIPFAQPGSLTRVYAVASGKGGVGKSSVTVNLATAMAATGLSVGVLDADIYGHSVPRMLGTDQRPTQVERMIMPPIAHDVKVISISMFTQGNTPVVWRGPMLHRALQQFLADVFWGDLDILLLDLPPGTGDVAISLAQLIPNAEILVVTTPQLAAAEVAERAGSIALQTRQRIAGVIENMSWLDLPDGTRMELYGSGGGQTVADNLTRAIGANVPCWARSRSNRACARRATRAPPSSCAPPRAPPARPSWKSPTNSPSAAAAWQACPSPSTPPATCSNQDQGAVSAEFRPNSRTDSSLILFPLREHGIRGRDSAGARADAGGTAP